MQEREIVVENAGVRLAGTTCLPDGADPFPFVVFLHGSGPLDRDENMPGQRLDVFNALAHRFATIGIASLRYDKRGCAASTGEFADAGLAELVSDAVASVNAARQLDSCSEIFLVAHSEGCILAPLVARELAQPVSGLVLLCPFLPPVEPLLIRQAEQIERDIQSMSRLPRFFVRLASGFRDPVASQRALLSKIRSSSTPTIRSGLHKIPVRSLRGLLALDPSTVFRDVTSPALLIGGEKDVQCDPADVERIRALLLGPVEAHVVPDLTHLLRLDSGTPSLLGAHQLLSQELAPVVLERTSDWLRRTRRSASRD